MISPKPRVLTTRTARLTQGIDDMTSTTLCLPKRRISLLLHRFHNFWLRQVDLPSDWRQLDCTVQHIKRLLNRRNFCCPTIIRVPNTTGQCTKKDVPVCILNTMKPTHSLEASKIFPYIAWITVILFSFFTYSLVLELQESIHDLEIKTDQTQTQLKTPSTT